MAQQIKEEVAPSIENDLLQIIKKDDVKAFDVMMEKTQCGAYRLGRFPVLSLLYLYKSKRILSAYEFTFLRLTNYVPLGEPIEISRKFSVKAKKCLRLYFNEVVSPIEMLLILDKVKQVKKVYQLLTVSSAVKGRLKSIYYIKYSLGVRFEGNEIILDRRPLTHLEKKRIATICLCVALAVVLVIGVPVTTVSLIPKPIEGEVTKLNQIDFTADKEYTLKKDIVLPANYTVKEVNCQITGDGKKLIFSKGAYFEVFNGKLSNLTLESYGDTIIGAINTTASIDNVTFNINCDITKDEDSAFISTYNYGTIQNVSLNVKGKIDAVAQSEEVNSEMIFSSIALANNGTIDNCTVDYTQFELKGEASANAVFGGAVGVNNRYLQNSTVTGKIFADTFDVSGICYYNGGVLSKNVNEADLTQTSADVGWNPVVSGIVSTNAYLVENCQNKGELSATSNCNLSGAEESIPTVSVAGIVNSNSNTVRLCSNSGKIVASGKGEAYVGGIAAHSYSRLANCLSSSDISVSADKVYAGGILGCSEAVENNGYLNFGITDSCISESKISVDSNTSAYIGGIAGYVKEIESNSKFIGGCVNNCYFIGTLAFVGENDDEARIGGIVGVCGANIYEINYMQLYSQFTEVEYYNLDGNFYSNSLLKAIGSTIATDDTLTLVEDKGATSMTVEAIKDLQKYNDILNALNL